MSIWARGLCRSLILPLREIQQSCRFVSSKQMVEKPGIGCCYKVPGDGCFEKAKKKVEEKKGKRQLGPPKKAIPKECMENPCCPDPPVPFDVQYKHLLKHKERKDYERTWVECPPRRVVQKVVCGAPEPEPEPDCKLEKKCPPPPSKRCDVLTGKCPKITMPGCKPAKVHKARCRYWAKPSNCVKIKAPYPSFSECGKPKPKPRKPNECDCLEMRMCEAITYYKKRGLKDKAKKMAQGKL